MVGGPIITLILLLLGIAALGLVIAFVLVPLFRGIGWAIGGVFTGIGWLLRHVFGFVSGMLRDIVRFVGTVIAGVVLLPLCLLNVIVGRWSAAGHFWRSMHRECDVALNCLYRVALQRPLRFLLLGGLLEGLEQRVNEAFVAAPPADRPGRRTGTFEGYTIIGSLPVGGSGAKLYVAEPKEQIRRGGSMPHRVVIKSFALSDGSSLPQIVRESRALEAARQLGLVLDHGMDEHRFYYVTPYHEGDHLGIVTRQLHGESEGQGLGARELATGLGYVADLLDTLSRYHGGGLWHKDVKPENVIVHDGRAHLVDLGLVTPLRSAMTLTTHGTEYFRDPEMVRMALRGVKVHQVDGAKFDIYAVGAVLYFLLENTFPAHGALSAFSRRSPEALRWIVRRAMADYSKRYETAAAVLADLGAVRAAADPYAVRPADLPSMGGSTPEAPHAAADGAPQRPREAAVASSAGSPRPPAAATAGFGHPGAGTGTRSWSEPTRPAVRVTNWWTGAYQAVEPGGAGALPAMSSQEARIYREEAAAFREHSEALREQVRRRTVSARRAAREQLRAARQRAEEVRRRARANRRRLVPEPQRVQPGVVMAFLTLLVAGAIALAAISRNAPRSPGAAVQEALGSAYAFRFSPDLALPDGRGTPLLLLNDHPAWTSPLVRSEVDRALEVLRLRGYHIVSGDKDAEARVRATGTIQAHEPIPAPLRAVLRQRKLGGVIRIYAAPGEGDVSERVEIVYTLPE